MTLKSLIKVDINSNFSRPRHGGRLENKAFYSAHVQKRERGRFQFVTKTEHAQLKRLRPRPTTLRRASIEDTALSRRPPVPEVVKRPKW